MKRMITTFLIATVSTIIIPVTPPCSSDTLVISAREFAETTCLGCEEKRERTNVSVYLTRSYNTIINFSERIIILHRQRISLTNIYPFGNSLSDSIKGSAVAQLLSVGLRSERSGFRNLPPPCCVIEQGTLLPPKYW